MALRKVPFPHLWILSSWHPTPAAPRTTSVPAQQTSCQRALSQIETGTRPSPSSGCDGSVGLVEAELVIVQGGSLC